MGGQYLGWNNYNIIQDRATQMAKVMKLGVIISTVKRNPCANRNCLKLQTCSFGASKASRNERNFDGLLSSKSLDIHGAMTTISSIANGEGQIIKLIRKSWDYLGNGTFSSSNQFNGCIPRRNKEMGPVDVFNRLERFNDPAWEWRNVIGLQWRKEYSIVEALNHMRANFEVSIQ